MGGAGEIVTGNPTTYRVRPTWVLVLLTVLEQFLVSVAVRNVMHPREN